MTYFTPDNLAVALFGGRHCHVSCHKTIITQTSTTHKTNSLLKRLSSEHLAARQPMTLFTQRALDIWLVWHMFGTVLKYVSETFRGSSLCRGVVLCLLLEPVPAALFLSSALTTAHVTEYPAMSSTRMLPLTKQLSSQRLSALQMRWCLTLKDWN